MSYAAGGAGGNSARTADEIGDERNENRRGKNSGNATTAAGYTATTTTIVHGGSEMTASDRLSRVDAQENEEARHGFAQWLIYMIRVTEVEIWELAEASDMSRDRICRFIAGEILPSTKEVRTLATAIEEVEDAE